MLTAILVILAVVGIAALIYLAPILVTLVPFGLLAWAIWYYPDIAVPLGIAIVLGGVWSGLVIWASHDR